MAKWLTTSAAGASGIQFLTRITAKDITFFFWVRYSSLVVVVVLCREHSVFPLLPPFTSVAGAALGDSHHLLSTYCLQSRQFRAMWPASLQ